MSLSDAQFNKTVEQIKSHPDFSANLEKHRAQWADTGKKYGWHKEGDHLPLQVWANTKGEIQDSVAHGGITKDMIIPTGNTFAKDEQWPGKCPDCDYFRKEHEAKTGRPVEHQEEYPGWDADWSHTHRK
jgi:hypothetical protein